MDCRECILFEKCERINNSIGCCMGDWEESCGSRPGWCSYNILCKIITMAGDGVEILEEW